MPGGIAIGLGDAGGPDRDGDADGDGRFGEREPFGGNVEMCRNGGAAGEPHASLGELFGGRLEDL